MTSLLVRNENKLGFGFFVGDVISGVGFWLILPDPGPNCKVEVFCWSFIGNQVRIWVFWL